MVKELVMTQRAGKMMGLVPFTFWEPQREAVARQVSMVRVTRARRRNIRVDTTAGS